MKKKNQYYENLPPTDPQKELVSIIVGFVFTIALLALVGWALYNLVINL